MFQFLKKSLPQMPKKLVLNTLVFSELDDGRGRGFGQRDGVLLVSDRKTGAELWALPVYACSNAERLRFHKMETTPDQKQLLITNSRRERFLLDLRTRSVQALDVPYTPRLRLAVG